MSKAILVSEIAAKTGVSKTQAGDFINAFCETVQEQISKGDDVSLIGFGTFYRAHRKATTGRNPRTGEAIQIKAANQPKFRAGKKFKEAVNS